MPFEAIVDGFTQVCFHRNDLKNAVSVPANVPPMDSTGIPVHGEQEHGAYNGHLESTGYHPLLLFNGWEMADHRESCDERFSQSREQAR